MGSFGAYENLPDDHGTAITIQGKEGQVLFLVVNHSISHTVSAIC